MPPAASVFMRIGAALSDAKSNRSGEYAPQLHLCNEETHGTTVMRRTQNLEAEPPEQKQIPTVVLLSIIIFKTPDLMHRSGAF